MKQRNNRRRPTLSWCCYDRVSHVGWRVQTDIHSSFRYNNWTRTTSLYVINDSVVFFVTTRLIIDMLLTCSHTQVMFASPSVHQFDRSTVYFDIIEVSQLCEGFYFMFFQKFDLFIRNFSQQFLANHSVSEVKSDVSFPSSNSCGVVNKNFGFNLYQLITTDRASNKTYDNEHSIYTAKLAASSFVKLLCYVTFCNTCCCCCCCNYMWMNLLWQQKLCNLQQL